MKEINSREYWNSRFESRDWEKNGGGKQTQYFAELFQKNIPEWMVNYVRDKGLSVLDLGCAQGEGTAVLSKMWGGQVSGADFSEDAVRSAKEKYPDIHFEVQDALDMKGTWDVIFMSNILEHFEKPYDVLSGVQKHARHMVIVLVPFEETMDIDEHFARFTFDSIPLIYNDFALIYSNNILEYADEYLGQQMLLVYSRDRELNRRVPLGESNNTIKKWAESHDYVHFKERLFVLANEYAYANKQLGSAEKQLEMDRGRADELERQLSESRSVAESYAQRLKENEVLNADLKRKLDNSEVQGKELQERLNESETQGEKLRRELKDSGTRNADLQRKIESDISQIAKLENELTKYRYELSKMKESAKDIKQSLETHIDELSANLEKKQTHILNIQDELASKEKIIKQLEESVQDASAKYENLYAYSSKRDDELVKITNSKSFQVFSKYIKPVLHYGYLVALKLYRIFRALLTLHLADLCKELFTPFARLLKKAKGTLEKGQVFSEIRNTIKSKTVIVLPPTLDWHMPLFQRPQQLAYSYSRKKDTVVIYLTKNIQYDKILVAEKVGSSLWVFNEEYAKYLKKILSNSKKIILSVSWTPNKKYIDMIHPDSFIYEYIDELEIFHMYGPEMESDHQRLMQEADVTVCTATKLYNQAVGRAKKALLSPNAGDYEFFAKTKDTQISPWIRDIACNYRCVLGYYGALASWFDYELVKTVAKRNPDWLFVLVGINYDGTLDKSGIDQFDNIVYVPPQPYQELPSFLTAFDVATIPFVINEITLSTSPVKLFEYMAGGKPILTSKMPECLKYESVRTYANADEFCRIVKEYLAMKHDDPYWSVLKKEALENTWDARTDQILEALNHN